MRASQPFPRLLTRRLRRLASLVLVLVAAYLLLSSVIGRLSTPAFRPEPVGSSPSSHPIDGLIARGHARWQAKLARQSSTLAEAVAEYRRRYGRAPPKGFDEWHAVATKANFKLIDEFDAIDEDLALFRHLSSAELRKRTRQASLLSTLYGVVHVQGTSSVVSAVNTGDDQRGSIERAKGFVEMLRPNAHRLPDMEFPLGAMSESLTLPPWEKVQPHNMSRDIEDVAPFVTVRNEFALWYKFANRCDPASPVRQRPDLYQWPLPSTIRPPHVGVDPAQLVDPLDLEAARALPAMQFLERTEAHLDMCSVSPDRFYEYGAMYAGYPAVTEVYPVFAPGKGPGAIDIRVPSYFLHRTNLTSYTYGYDEATDTLNLDNPKDPQWEDKEDTIYWRGSMTGGGNSPSGRYAYYQRHRLVQLAGQTSNLSIPLVRHTGRSEGASLVPVEDLRQALDISFTRVVQCAPYPGGCAQMERDYAISPWVPLDDAFRAKMVLDLDGMGYSARFFALLASRSAPVKTTIYREFFDDWLEPWVHYIPASSHYQELFNIWAYFLGDSTPNGDAALRRIAADSRSAKLIHLRPVDIEHVYRLALEWARLWYKDFEDMDYHLSAPSTPS